MTKKPYTEQLTETRLDEKCIEPATPIAPAGHRIVTKKPKKGDYYFYEGEWYLSSHAVIARRMSPVPTLEKIDPLELEGQELVDYLNEMMEATGDLYVPPGWGYDGNAISCGLTGDVIAHRGVSCQGPPKWHLFRGREELYGVLHKPEPETPPKENDCVDLDDYEVAGFATHDDGRVTVEYTMKVHSS